MKRVLYWTLLVLITLIGVIGLLMSLCGGFFTIVRIEYSPLWLALLSLVFGCAIVWLSLLLGKKIRKSIDDDKRRP